MSLARELVELEGRIRDETGVDLFLPLERGGLLGRPECASILSRIGFTDPALIMRLCLQALRVQHDELRPRLLDAELVATLPPDTPGIARTTQSVIREMVDRAAKEIILLGYELNDRDLVRLLAGAATRGASVIVICDRARGATARVLESWPTGTRRPRMYHDRARTDGVPYAKMHAKCLLVDSNDLLITSANFTFHGLHGNIEIGVRLIGAAAAEARKIFSHLVEANIVEEVNEPGTDI